MHSKNRDETRSGPRSTLQSQVDNRRHNITLPADVLSATLDRGKPAAWVAIINIVHLNTIGHQEELFFPVCEAEPTLAGALEIRMTNPATVRIRNTLKPRALSLFLEIGSQYNVVSAGKYKVAVFERRVQAKIWHEEELYKSKPKPKNRTIPKIRTRKRK
jgi:hypothetical protein